MGRPPNALLVLHAVDALDRGSGTTTHEIVRWIRKQGYEGIPPRAIAQIASSIPGAILKGRPRGAYARWYRGPLMADAVQSLHMPP